MAYRNTLGFPNPQRNKSGGPCPLRQYAQLDARELGSLFLERLKTPEEGTPDHRYARNALIEMNPPLEHFAAKRFRNRGRPTHSPAWCPPQSGAPHSHDTERRIPR
ncbi:hypothetical protein SGR_6663 [Streptomyces griseus subsp. griseus NBRC 13350]|uniref:RNA polymerase sigma factor n=1 Tax=Streptomyces griseus subsp. griseus (strain JCM 4626 / CBS 651.72 / NBRC 13350 / KCC S-0626 / ISP 5235) TaxID=455632 RepID=B1VLV1_STRGG|nr:hypothetical protein SGR_6663 [Streptomyces griseus subsp. griseus NBRC 13350]SEE33247.1 hypothetical protein SAMN04490359_2762 [Streptomyces griseus]SQA25131.1 RNA polymerase sigma factor [Streptomyces griseus]